MSNIQINHWLPREFRFCGWPDARVVQGEIDQIGSPNRSDGDRWRLCIEGNEDDIMMIGAIASFHGGILDVSGFVENKPYTGEFRRELWIVLSDDMEDENDRS